MMKVAVIGAGTMGNGIAHSFAQNSFDVLLIDANPEQLERALITIQQNLSRQVKKGQITQELLNETINRISTSLQVDETIKEYDLVVEAVYEDEATKTAIFQELDRLTNEATILASNTSSISITKISDTCQLPERVIGMHFMNPVPVMELVEVIKGKSTNSKTVDKTIEICKSLKKIPVLANDHPGFVANRILMPMINEAILALEQGVSGTEEIDQIMRLGMAHPMGPLELADLIGLDVCFNIMMVLYKGFKNDKYKPAALLTKMVEKGHLGRKTGAGFYIYQQGTKEKTVAPF